MRLHNTFIFLKNKNPQNHNTGTLFDGELTNPQKNPHHRLHSHVSIYLTAN